MAGGAGNDTFVFRANLGQDTVIDFMVGSDVLEFRDGVFADAAAVLAAAAASGSYMTLEPIAPLSDDLSLPAIVN
ncbi:Ca2+-binding RTX toxin-like protein [Bradyrhizobium sp. AZCC 1578]|uniref:hypothetical protein n=1 Tax=Bradyrhizobium sp. AZCC 1578 TaxID=3117027 RepID=UPI002FF27F1F